jgi:hypothetical protein
MKTYALIALTVLAALLLVVGIKLSRPPYSI